MTESVKPLWSNRPRMRWSNGFASEYQYADEDYDRCEPFTLYTCTLCFSLVNEDRMGDHTDYHRTQGL